MSNAYVSSRDKARTEGHGPRKPRRSGLTDRQLAAAMAAPAAVLIIVFAFYPFAMAVWNSFNDVDYSTGVATWSGLANYVAIFSQPETLGSIARSAVWTFANLVLQVLLGVGVALLLNAGLRFQSVARGLVLFPYMVPAIVVALIFRFMFNDVTGLINYLLQTIGLIDAPASWLSDPATLLGTIIVVNVWKYTPFFVIIVLARLQTVPKELYEAVSVDGGGARHRFSTVTVPAIVPVLLAGALLRTIWTAYDFDLPFLLSNGGGPDRAAVTVPLEIRSLAFESQSIGQASALAVCTAILLTGAAYFYLRGFRRAERATG
ncbi:carbohydrate ABC transporter permease [Microlunatus speluncae]|uniref:carbohydrate ABC transporter permease n=1 Tax=Microlunatus speluncae TaxID=2594267 RepID=UPI001266346D|nr:sugar ABC transporter permease [Microlunatus speluncae]